MPLVLSTKILSQAQKRHLFAAGIDLVEYNAIKIKALNPDLETREFENAIFTSQNAVKLAIAERLQIKNVFCVGHKTSDILKQNNIDLKAQAENAKALANLIVEKYPEKSFIFFCSKQRRDDLPNILKQNNISLKEYHLYESVCNYKTFPNQFDAILCFSPLGVKTYYEMHSAKTLAVCIGHTTADMAERYTEKVLVATKTSIESVLIKTINIIGDL